MRRSVIDPQRVGPPTHIDAERSPRERLLKNALSEIASEKQSVRAFGSERRQKSQFGDSDILRLVHHDKIKRRFAPVAQIGGYTSEQFSPGQHVFFHKPGADPLKNRPCDLTLLPADPSFATKPGDIPVSLPGRE